MTKPFEDWKVLPHGKLVQVDDGMLTVTGDINMPLVKFTRRMTVVRLSDGGLVIFSAISLDEDEMTALERFGRPAFLVVPNAHHRLDAKVWKDRYPAMQVVAPEGARKEVDETVEVDTASPDFGDSSVQFVTVPGTQGRESALVVNRDSGTTLILNDLVANITDASGIGGWMLKLAGFAGDDPHIPSVVKMTLVKDEDALRAQLLGWADIATLKRILVSHGAPIVEGPRDVLRHLATALT